MECLESYNAATGRNVTVLQPGTIFAYDWHKVHPKVDAYFPDTPFR